MQLQILWHPGSPNLATIVSLRSTLLFPVSQTNLTHRAFHPPCRLKILRHPNMEALSLKIVVITLGESSVSISIILQRLRLYVRSTKSDNVLMAFEATNLLITLHAPIITQKDASNTASLGQIRRRAVIKGTSVYTSIRFCVSFLLRTRNVLKKTAHIRIWWAQNAQRALKRDLRLGRSLKDPVWSQQVLELQRKFQGIVHPTLLIKTIF